MLACWLALTQCASALTDACCTPRRRHAGARTSALCSARPPSSPRPAAAWQLLPDLSRRSCCSSRTLSSAPPNIWQAACARRSLAGCAFCCPPRHLVSLCLGVTPSTYSHWHTEDKRARWWQGCCVAHQSGSRELLRRHQAHARCAQRLHLGITRAVPACRRPAAPNRCRTRGAQTGRAGEAALPRHGACAEAHEAGQGGCGRVARPDAPPSARSLLRPNSQLALFPRCTGAPTLTRTSSAPPSTAPCAAPPPQHTPTRCAASRSSRWPAPCWPQQASFVGFQGGD